MSDASCAAVRDHGPVAQFHWDPEGYGAEVRAEVPGYDAFQDRVARAAATGSRSAGRALELGTGTGRTTLAVLARQPDVHVVGLDGSEQMLTVARARLPLEQVDLVVGRLDDELPPGRFDVVFSALAVHHLDGPGKAQLFRRVYEALAPGGRFVLGDVVVPDGDVAEPIPLEPGVDLPDRVDDQLRWLADAGFTPTVAWAAGDLAVLTADRSG
jgi:tRNA (cmo5U34)-methyltransferase